MKKTYLVTERAGPWVAGQRVPETRLIELSDSQAEYELALGTITRMSDDEQPTQKTMRRKAGQTSEAPAWNETQHSVSTLIE